MKNYCNKICLAIFFLFTVSSLMPINSFAMAGRGYQNYDRGGMTFGQLILTLIVLIIIFLILREVNCWYWKINERLTVLKEIRDLLKQNEPSSSNATTEPSPQAPAPSPKVPAPSSSAGAKVPPIPKKTQLRVTMVTEKGYGERVGLKPEDIIYRINSKHITCDRDCTIVLNDAKKAGMQKIDIGVIREGQKHHLTAPLVPLGIKCRDEEINQDH